jgi:ferric-dicitrate binding protein FerR (iron transport regulator)
MSEERHEQALDALLGHRDTLPGDSFVLEVMDRIRSERRRRRRILLAFGLAGAAFGLAGAWQLAEPVAQLFAGLPQTALMQAVLLTCGGLAFYTWCMHEDLGLAI